MAFYKTTQGNVNMVHHHLCCSCSSDEHQLNFRFFTEDKEDALLYCTVHLKEESNFFKRMWKGVKYIFGHKSKYGNFDEVILDKEKVTELKCVLESFEKFNEDN